MRVERHKKATPTPRLWSAAAGRRRLARRTRVPRIPRFGAGDDEDELIRMRGYHLQRWTVNILAQVLPLPCQPTSRVALLVKCFLLNTASNQFIIF